MKLFTERRLMKELTQEKLAELCDVASSSISLYENGKRRPSVEVAKKIAKVLDFDWTEFYEE